MRRRLNPDPEDINAIGMQFGAALRAATSTPEQSWQAPEQASDEILVPWSPPEVQEATVFAPNSRVVAYMGGEHGRVLLRRDGNRATIYVPSGGPLLISDAAFMYGPLVELVPLDEVETLAAALEVQASEDVAFDAWIQRVSTWRPPAEIPTLKPRVYADATGGLWKVAEHDSNLLWGFGSDEPLTRAMVVSQYGGPLLPLVELAAARQAIAAAPIRPGPDVLGTFGFEGKFIECARRTPDGPWCEWRHTLRRLSLLALMELAAAHAEEVHGA